jgi:hypothetical protein
MAQSREIPGDPASIYKLVLNLLTNMDVFNEWELTFLQNIRSLTASGVKPSAKQFQKLIEIRDDVPRQDVTGINVRSLIDRCYASRFELDEDDEQFIAAMWHSGLRELRGYDLRRVKRISKQLNELEEYM